MFFNSAVFLFFFLPVTLLVYYLISKTGKSRIALFWLLAVSIFFYAWAGFASLILISVSIMFNYIFGRLLVGLVKRRRLILAAGVVLNILLLGYFKYANFFISNTNSLFDTNLHIHTVLLPLAISFFTLQQIAFLVDVYRGEREEFGFWEYCLFVMFFPKLLSGPIVRLKEMMPQIVKNFKPYISSQNLAVGITILCFGLFKKVIIADRIGVFADAVFNAAAGQGGDISFFNGWSGALAYTLQLYFDFSAYSDMAIGLGLMFGIKLPLNFYSPYKATSIIDFWRRWHITLSNFIRDYIYIPLGGNRRGFLLQTVFLLLAMSIAGLWHGAGWTFVIWGALHGVYLAVNHTFRYIKKPIKREKQTSSRWGTGLSILVTFTAVVIAWVFFRADSVSSAIEILKGMVGMNGFHVPVAYYATLGPFAQLLQSMGVSFDLVYPLPGFSWEAIVWIVAALAVCWLLPNVQEYMSNYEPALDHSRFKLVGPRFSWLRWKPSVWNAAVTGILIILIMIWLNQLSKFIYFGF